MTDELWSALTILHMYYDASVSTTYYIEIIIIIAHTVVLQADDIWKG